MEWILGLDDGEVVIQRQPRKVLAIRPIRGPTPLKAIARGQSRFLGRELREVKANPTES